jgi:transposase-like protein
MKQSNTTYDQYVKMGRDLVNQINSHQAQLAYYATKVCEIKHGGKTRSTVYTIKKYAEDVGVHHKTLSEWVSVYRNVISKIDLDPEKVTKKDWSVARRVQNLFNEEKRTVQSIMGMSGKKERGCRQDVSKERVKDLFNQNYDGPSFQSEVYSWNDYVIFVKNKLLSRDLDKVSTSSLISLKENLDKASDIILKHITKSEVPKKVKTRRVTKPVTVTA